MELSDTLSPGLFNLASVSSFAILLCQLLVQQEGLKETLVADGRFNHLFRQMRLDERSPLPAAQECRQPALGASLEKEAYVPVRHREFLAPPPPPPQAHHLRLQEPRAVVESRCHLHLKRHPLVTVERG